jgi:hypothetical protein
MIILAMLQQKDYKELILLLDTQLTLVQLSSYSTIQDLLFVKDIPPKIFYYSCGQFMFGAPERSARTFIVISW